MTASMLDDLLPDYDKRERHAKWIPDSAEQVFQALLSLRINDLRLTPALLRLRGGPATWFQGLGEHQNLLVLDAIAPARLVDDPPRELVLGDIARYTAVRPYRPQMPRGDPAAFRDFAEPGWTKVAMNFLLTPDSGGTMVHTETRVWSTDAATRRTFGLYWLVVGAGSALIRREILAGIARVVRSQP